jgi:DhnA family fructose-bisphosphate aldolase class Ia
MNGIHIPADVPQHAERDFIDNYYAITKNSDRLFLFSCDQKIEHLHDAFDPDKKTIHEDALHPEHLFKIAAQGDIGAMATQLELIARYGKQHSTINYIAKLNSKTNLISSSQKDPVSAPLWSVADVVTVKNDARLFIRGIGVTIYLGSEFEDEMLSFASEAIFDAHQQGLVAILWMYPRGKAVKDETDAHLLAGAAGAANALGADFVKIKAPASTDTESSAERLKEIVAAAGNTRVICAGGEQLPAEKYIQTLYEQLTIGGTAGTATGRNIFQHSLPQAIAMTRAISTLVYHGATPQKAMGFVKE